MNLQTYITITNHQLLECKEGINKRVWTLNEEEKERCEERWCVLCLRGVNEGAGMKECMDSFLVFFLSTHPHLMM